MSITGKGSKAFRVKAIIKANGSQFLVELWIEDTRTGDREMFRSYPTDETRDQIETYLRQTYSSAIDIEAENSNV